MTTVWEVPVAPRDAVLSRRMLRALPEPMPREARPTRALRERVSPYLRVWGAASRKRG
jgi:hypothetical protein